MLNGVSVDAATHQWEQESEPWADRGLGGAVDIGAGDHPWRPSSWACLCPTHCAPLLPWLLSSSIHRSPGELGVTAPQPSQPPPAPRPWLGLCCGPYCR